MQKSKSIKSKKKTAEIIPPSTNETATKKDIDKLLAPLSEEWKKDLFRYWLAEPSISIAGICDTYNIDKTDVSVALKIDKVFNSLYNKVRKICDKIELMNLESVSEKNALEPKNMVERLFRLKSLDRDRYADRGKNAGANIDINISFGDGVTTYNKKNSNFIDAEVSTASSNSKPHNEGLSNIIKGV